MKIFLKAKHWQLFLLFFAIPFLIQMVMMIWGMIKMFSSEDPDPSEIVTYFKFIPLVILPFMLILYGWFWSLAIGLQSRVPRHLEMKPNRFKLVLLLYAIVVMLTMIILFNKINFTQIIKVPFDTPTLIILMPLYVISILCLLYLLYFIAKTLRSAELHREAVFSEYFAEIVLLWLNPVGVWFIQPRVNKLLNDGVAPDFPDLPGSTSHPEFPPVPNT